jgi:hypothetical protein
LRTGKERHRTLEMRPRRRKISFMACHEHAKEPLMNTLTARRSAALLLGSLALACAVPAQAQGWHGGGHYRGGWGPGPWWGLGVGLGLGLVASSAYDRDVIVVDRPAYYYPPTPVYVYPPAPVPVAAPAPVAVAATATFDPIFYPRNGQTSEQTEADRQACNRWATSYPKAVSDASIFQRAALACMDGRGYTSR